MSMPGSKAKPQNNPLRALPSVDELLRCDAGRLIATSAGNRHAAALARRIIGNLRGNIGELTVSGKADLLELAARSLAEEWQQESRSGIRRVINATGVVIHTN